MGFVAKELRKLRKSMLTIIDIKEDDSHLAFIKPVRNNLIKKEEEIN